MRTRRPTAIAATAGLAAARLVVLSAVRPEPLLDVAGMLEVVGAAHRVAIGGRGAGAASAALAGVERLPDDAIAAADLVSAPSAA